MDASPPTAPQLSPSEARSRDSEAWNTFASSFAAGSKVALSAADVPWPCLGHPLPGVSELQPQELKVLVRALQRRWHPDKFKQKFGSFLDVSEKGAVLGRVVEVCQAINALQS